MPGPDGRPTTSFVGAAGRLGLAAVGGLHHRLCVDLVARVVGAIASWRSVTRRPRTRLVGPLIHEAAYRDMVASALVARVVGAIASWRSVTRRPRTRLVGPLIHEAAYPVADRRGRTEGVSRTEYDPSAVGH